jgi:hypothetical protein
MRGSRPSRRWRRGWPRTAVSGAAAKEQRRGGRQRKKKGKRKPGVDVKFHKLPGTLM